MSLILSLEFVITLQNDIIDQINVSYLALLSVCKRLVLGINGLTFFIHAYISWQFFLNEILNT